MILLDYHTGKLPSKARELTETKTRLIRGTGTQTAGWFLDLRSAGRLDLDPPYQRRSVWNVGFQQFFIDSLIRNYPAPTIFLQVDVFVDEPTIYRVIDGKQRLTSLIEFRDDKFATPDSLEDIGLAGLYYSELAQEIKLQLLEYIFTVEQIRQASPGELNQAFDRLNRNVARLNKQELRHARFEGAFIRKVEQFAEHPFWVQIGLVTPARIRRMQDVEYISELYVISLAGIQEGKDYLEDIYAEHDREITGESEADANFFAVQDFLAKLDAVYPIKTTRFSNVADFYSLWAALSQIISSGSDFPDVGDVADRLAEFSDEIEAQRSRRSNTYRIAAVQGSNKKANREYRAKCLTEILMSS
ncbi:DUF262 domain-containing protein [Kribbella sp. DT2]|uniref:DUF262 domain-containing protein n=1 Tax=Kribbella sp. DT2 TaxID=3393427 RepID=UPI003CF1E68A